MAISTMILSRIVVCIAILIAKIFSWVLVSHEKYSLQHFQQRNNSRQNLSQTTVFPCAVYIRTVRSYSSN